MPKNRNTRIAIEKTKAIMLIILGIPLAISVIGIPMIISGVIINKRIKLFKTYVAVLSANHDRSIECLAGKTGKSFDYVAKQLKIMIKKNYFTNAYIDIERNAIVFADQGSVPVQRHEYVTVNCSGCGAVNKIPKNSVGECSFCGTELM